MVDLADKDTLQFIMEKYKPDRVIHLAALAHAADGKKLRGRTINISMWIAQRIFLK